MAKNSLSWLENIKLEKIVAIIIVIKSFQVKIIKPLK